jgi:hypothetical protein
MTSTTSTRLFLAISSLLCLSAVWLLTGVSQVGGSDFFLGAAVTLAVCLCAAARGWRRPLFALYLAVAMTTFVVGALEGLLCLFPSVLKGSIANAAYSRYHTMRGGMYTPDPHLGFTLKPNYACNAYWQGHWWRHTTNAAGYRGDLLERADAVFLGDSMIYGHGVEDDETVSSQFAARTGWTVANLGQQGTCPIQMAIRLRRTGVGLQPKVVFLCNHVNDITDSTATYDADELRRYVAADAAELYEPTARRAFWSRHGRRSRRRVWDSHLAPSLYLSGALIGVQQAWSNGSLRGPQCNNTPGQRSFVPKIETCELPFDPLGPSATEAERLGWQAHVKALAQIAFLCRRQGAQLVLLDIGYPHAFSRAIEDLAGRMDVSYSPAGRVALKAAFAGEEVYLANDGHWTPRGIQIIGTELESFARPFARAPANPHRQQELPTGYTCAIALDRKGCPPYP